MNFNQILKHRLTGEFFTRQVNQVAKDLLGKFLVKVEPGQSLVGKIVETEAYDGLTDEASHSFRGKTARNEVMFEEGGLLYVYFTYGMYFCSNIVTGQKGHGAAVLLRAVEPLNGIEIMQKRRFGEKEISSKQKFSVCNGPGKLCIAYGFNKAHNGTDLTKDNIFITGATAVPESEIETTERIGIKKSVDLKWRYYIKNNPYISRK